MKHQKQILEKYPIFYSNKKNKVPRKKTSQGGKATLFRKIYNTEEIKEDRNKWKLILCSWKEELTSSKCPYYSKQLIDLMQSLLKYQ